MTFFSKLHPELAAQFVDAEPTLHSIRDIVSKRPFTHFSKQEIDFTDVIVSESTIDSNSYPLRVIICKPRLPMENAPCIIWYHGGGMVFGTPDDSVGYMLDFVRRFKAIVVIPNYRLAPEFPYPTGLFDSYNTLLWVDRNADQLNISRKKIIVAGGSAGGNLCVAVSLLARDKKGPAIAFQLPLYPMLDYQNNRPSNLELTTPLVWNHSKNKEAWEMYLHRADKVDSYASPSYAQNYESLPPTYTFVGTLDLFRDEVMDFVQRLTIAQVPVEFHLYNGCTHGFDLDNTTIGRQAKEQLLAVTKQYIERYC
ncbi:alpha/beta hydrolase [Solibacillus sp. CAU 1738]|uniref:alpha/beta hydrolase n=1 Tax=Solibacillus sp. CAU 1738 TaxID=3140363 RepID=UPI0032619BB2